jgi:tRNA(fMet)-specific endonuclease VapC
MFLLDTNVIITILRGDGKTFLERMIKGRRESYQISVITVFELEIGIQKARTSGMSAKKIEEKIEEKIKLLAYLKSHIRTAYFGDVEAVEAAKVRTELEQAGQGIGPMDTLLAGTARVHGWTLVTANTKEFQRVNGLKLESWLGLR